MLDPLIKKSDSLKKEADILLEKTDIVNDLKSFGEVSFIGAYAGNVMLDPDIDIAVTREDVYSVEEILDIFRSLFLKGSFRSYFIKGDWDDRRKGKEFPDGHYIGLKQRLNNIKWVVDVWFMDKDQFEDRNKKFFSIANFDLSDEQRKCILEFKKYRNDRSLDISSQEIYQAVVERDIRDIQSLF